MLAWLGARPGGEAGSAELREALPGSAAAIRALRAKGWIEPRLLAAVEDPLTLRPGALQLNEDQASALASLTADLDGFSVSLLDGVTGSGKTEVYLQLAAEVLAAGQERVGSGPGDFAHAATSAALSRTSRRDRAGDAFGAQ